MYFKTVFLKNGIFSDKHKDVFFIYTIDFAKLINKMGNRTPFVLLVLWLIMAGLFSVATDSGGIGVLLSFVVLGGTIVSLVMYCSAKRSLALWKKKENSSKNDSVYNSSKKRKRISIDIGVCCLINETARGSLG